MLSDNPSENPSEKVCAVRCVRKAVRTPVSQGAVPVPQHRWMDITMDFIVDLPVCTRRGRQHRHLMVVVDRLSKEFRAEPLTSLEVEEVFDAMNRRVFSQGLPCSIVSDRGSQFVSHLWKRICQRRGVKVKLSSAGAQSRFSGDNRDLRRMRSYQ